jgi:ribonuclease P protein component
VGADNEGGRKLRTLRSREQFRAVYERGSKFHTPFFSVFILATEEDSSRFGITATRKLGNAVVRNRCKRRLREIVKRDASQIAGISAVRCCDIVINVKQSTIDAAFSELSEAFSGTLKQYFHSLDNPGKR